MSTFSGRLKYFMNVSDPKNFFYSDDYITEAIKTWRRYERKAETEGKGDDKAIMVTEDEKAEIKRGMDLAHSNANDRDELVPRYFRMCGFVPINVPIVVFMLIAKPTFIGTAGIHFINQTYNAGLNYGNRNSSSRLTNQDLAKSYMAALTTSITIAIGLRALTLPVTRGATGAKLVLLNAFVNGSANASANFVNTKCMRYKEIETGIDVFADEKLTKKVGVSKIAGNQAVTETALTRSVKSLMNVSFASAIIIPVTLMGLMPQTRALKFMIDNFSVFIGLRLGLPISQALFPPIIESEGAKLEEDLRNHDKLYFSKGL